MAAMTGDDQEPMENWRQFQGTELGGLMSQIYGAQRPKINYPKPKAKSTFQPSEKGFIPGGASGEAADPRKSTMNRDVKIAKPKFGRRHTADNIIHPIDTLARRKNETVIKAELEDIKLRQTYYRPAFRPAVSSDQEKERLSQICTYKGGKALPAEFVMPVCDAPFELEAKQRQQELEAKHRAKRLGIKESKAPSPAAISPHEQLLIQITKEIDERREYLEEMKTIGISPEQEQRIRAEISQRLMELKRLDS